MIPVLSGVGLDASNSSWHTRSSSPSVGIPFISSSSAIDKLVVRRASPMDRVVRDPGSSLRHIHRRLSSAHQAHGDSQGDGVNYKRKTITLTWSNDRFKNVEALEHEVIHAALWERGFRDTDSWAIRDWVYFSDETLPLLFHDNPQFAEYLTAGY